MGKTGSCLVGRALLCKALIQLSADGWGRTPSQVVFGPKAIQPSGLWALGSMVKVMATSKRVAEKTFPDSCCQSPHPCGQPLLTHTSTGDPTTRAGSFRSVSCGVIAAFLWSLVYARFCLCPPRLKWSLCFPQSCGSLVIKSYWPSRSDSLGIPRHFVRSQAGKPGVGFRTLTRVGKLLWYYCSSICHPPGGHGIWLLWFCPSYYLTVASSLSLDVGYLFLVGSGVLLLVVVRCSTASCDFGALAGGGMCASFYSATLNQPHSINFWEFDIETPT